MGQGGLAIPDVPCCYEHRLLALLAGYAVHRELGDVVTAVGVHFRELGEQGTTGQKRQTQASLLSPAPPVTLHACRLCVMIAPPLLDSVPESLPCFHATLATWTPNAWALTWALQQCFPKCELPHQNHLECC